MSLRAGGWLPLLHGIELHALAVGNLYLGKKLHDPSLRLDYKNAFELD